MSEKEKKGTLDKLGSGIGNLFSKGGFVLVAVTGVGLIVYFLYQYLQSGLETAKAGYTAAIKDLMEETKQFIKNNEAQGIHGLTAEQQAVIQTVKQPQIEFWEKQLSNELAARQGFMGAIGETVLVLAISAGVAIAAPRVADALRSKGGNVKIQVEQASQGWGDDSCIQNSWSMTDFALQMTAWDLALEGNIAAASGLQDSITQMYNTMMLPGLQTQQSYLTTELSSLLVGTSMYMAVTQMLIATQSAIALQTIPTFINPTFMPLPFPI